MDISNNDVLWKFICLPFRIGLLRPPSPNEPIPPLGRSGARLIYENPFRPTENSHFIRCREFRLTLRKTHIWHQPNASIRYKWSAYGWNEEKNSSKNRQTTLRIASKQNAYKWMPPEHFPCAHVFCQFRVLTQAILFYCYYCSRLFHPWGCHGKLCRSFWAVCPGCRCWRKTENTHRLIKLFRCAIRAEQMALEDVRTFVGIHVFSLIPCTHIWNTVPSDIMQCCCCCCWWWCFSS